MSLGRLIAVFILAHITFGGGRLVLSLAALDRGASALALGLLLGSTAIAPVLLSVRHGQWIDRVGYRAPSAVGLVMLVAGAVIAAQAQGVAGLFPGAMLLGAGFMLLQLAVNNAVGHGAKPEQRTQAFSRLAVGNSVSTALGPLVAGAVIDAAGHRASFLCIGVTALLSLAIVLATPASASAPTPVRLRPRVRELLADPALRAVLVISALTTTSWDIFHFLLPLHANRLGFSATTIGIVMAVFGVATLVARAAVPRLLVRWGEWGLLSAAVWGSAVVYAAMPFAREPVLLGALSVILGLGLGLAQPSVLSLLHRTAPPGRSAEAVGVRIVLMNASQAVLPMCAGLVGLSLGVAPLFWGFAAFVAGGAMYARVSRPGGGL